MSAPQKVIWIGLHDMTRTGVPVMLLRLMRASPLVRRSSIHVVAINGGPLLEEFRSLVGSVTVLEPDRRRSVSGAVVAGVRSVSAAQAAQTASDLLRSGFWKAQLRSARVPAADVLVIHGAGAWPLVGAVGRNVQVVLHLHELATALDRSIPRSRQNDAIARAANVMVVSNAVADLARSRGAESDRIVVVPGVVDEIADTTRWADKSADIATGATLDPDGRWVVGIGTPGWRKGTDRLAPVAFELERRSLNASVAWVGGRPSGQDATWVDGADPVCWIGECVDPWRHAADASLILIPSREDPLPLVALEAGQRGLPVVAMPTGGLVDLLGSGRGVIAQRQNLGDLVDSVEVVLRDPVMAEDLGLALFEYVTEHHLATTISKQWWAVIDDAARNQ